MVKLVLYILGATCVAAWSLFELINGLATGVIDLPAARGHAHRSVDRALDPVAFWVGAMIWVVIAVIAGYVVWVSVRRIQNRG